ncbi:MAG: hypothetical protein AAF092_02465 [Pseudomonadota bacterium]
MRRQNGRGAELKAVFWVNGESDAHRQTWIDDPGFYYRCLECVYTDMRARYGSQVKFVVQQLSGQMPKFQRKPDHFPGWRPVMEAQRDLSEAYENVVLIETDRLISEQFSNPRKAFKDGFHYSDAAYAMFVRQFVRIAFERPKPKLVRVRKYRW